MNEERNRQLAYMHHELGITLDECGQSVGITRERVRQVIARYRPVNFQATRQQFFIAKRKAQFWANIDITANPDECWVWTGYQNLKTGYGHVNMKLIFTSSATHVIAFTLHNQCRPQNWVLHHCDNPPCCNPNHLYDGTPKQNAQDRIRRNRDGSAKRRRYIEYNGEMKSLREWSKTTVATPSALRRRLHDKWCFACAYNMPIQAGFRKKGCVHRD